MRKLFSLIFLVVLIVLSVPKWRLKAMLLLFGANPPKGVIYKPKSTALPIATFSASSIKVNIYSIAEFTPKMDAFKLKDSNLHYVLLETSIENITDSIINPSWFNTTYFVEDNKGCLVHNYLDMLTGYYEENHVPKDTVSYCYTTDKLEKRTALPRKYFFFPMYKDAKPVKIHFDDPQTKKPFQFPIDLK
ncbi:MAG: hypothetical protein U0T31_09660 [Chitinophagales bacterium]|nr:hypothetical protein [Chitinophagales bacterium]